MAAATDAVWLDVLPSMRGFRSEMTKQLRGMKPVELAAPVIPQPDAKGWVGRLASGIKSQAGQVYRAADELGGTINRRVGQVLAGGMIAGGAVIAKGLWGGLQRALDREDAIVTFRRMGLGDENIKQLTDAIDEALRGTPITNPEGFALAGRFLAQGFEEADVPRMVSIIADMSAGANREFSEIADVMVAASGAGRVTAAEFNRLGDLSLGRVAEEMGMTEGEMRKMASAGELTADAFMDAFAAVDIYQGAAKDATTRVAWSNLWTQVSQLGEQFLGPLLGEGGAAQTTLLSLRENVAKLGPFIADLGQRFADWLIPAMKSAGEWITGTLVPAFQNVVGWIRDNREMLTRLAKAAGPVVLAVAGIASSINLVSKAMKLLGMSGPMLIITGIATALMYAWQNSETFRDVVRTVVDWIVDNVWPALKETWEGIAEGARVMWENFLKPAWEGIKTAIEAAVVWVQETGWPILKTVWDAIATAATWLWENVLKPAWEGIKTAVEVAVLAIQAYWQYYLKPVWEAVASVAQWLWNSVLKRIFQFISGSWKLAVEGIKVAWERILKPAWDAVSSALRTLWNNVLSPIFGWIGDRWDDALLGMRIVWNTVLKPAWEAIRRTLRSLWDNHLKPVFRWIGDTWDTALEGMKLVWETVLEPAFDAIRRAVGRVKSAFETAVSGIKSAWDGIKEAAKAPIRFVVNTVINRGVIDNFNRIASVFGASGIDRLTLPPGFATGGWARGPGTGTSDSILARVSDGEFIVRADQAARWGPLLEQINTPGYSIGGWVRDRVSSAVSGLGSILRSPVDWLLARVDSLLSGIGNSPLARLAAGVPRRIVSSMAGVLSREPQVAEYDGGGWLPPGVTVAVNNTGRPEPVLTAQQFDAIAAGGGGFSGVLRIGGRDFAAYFEQQYQGLRAGEARGAAHAAGAR